MQTQKFDLKHLQLEGAGASPPFSSLPLKGEIESESPSASSSFEDGAKAGLEFIRSSMAR